MVFKKEYSGIYDHLYKDKDYQKECDYLELLFKKYQRKPRTILDLGCGTGGHALILAKRGFAVTGIDRSEGMLARARKKAKDNNLKIDFIKRDITEISWKRKFDAVISMFAVMSYQTTNAAIASVCKLAEKSLDPGGLFIFDCWHGPAVLADRPAARKKEVTLDNGEKIVRFSESQLDVINHTVSVTFRVLHTKNEYISGTKRQNRPEETKESHLLRFLFPQEIKYFLEVAGFNQVNFHPFLKLNRNLSEKDWNMMVVGKI